MDLNNKKILLSAGPTYEPIDPVRFIGNHSSGKMGFAIAKELLDQGAQVILIAGPTHLSLEHPSLKRVDVFSANDMYTECVRYFPECDGVIMAAAVADFTPALVAPEKIKKGEMQQMTIDLKPTKDILLHLGKMKLPRQFVAGFSLETENEKENAQKKLRKKNLDFIVLNSLRDKEAGFGKDTNKITIFDKFGKEISFPAKTKKEVAKDIINFLKEIF